MESLNYDVTFMEIALDEARKAALADEVPVGAALVFAGEVIARAHNTREITQCALMHAEVAVISAGCGKLGTWRLSECDLYVTLEPCPMCCGAIINSRIRRLVFGAYDPKAGCCGSMLDLFSYPFNHRPTVSGGVKQDECAALLKDFFAKKRRSPAQESHGGEACG